MWVYLGGIYRGLLSIIVCVHCNIQSVRKLDKTQFEMKLLILLGLVLPGKLCVARYLSHLLTYFVHTDD
jgi:hypothetical protein